MSIGAIGVPCEEPRSDLGAFRCAAADCARLLRGSPEILVTPFSWCAHSFPSRTFLAGEVETPGD